MRVRIKRIDKKLPLPKLETEGSVGFDLIARCDVVVHHHRPSLIPANIIVEVPVGYMLMITLRSSTPRKHELIMPHGVGIIDQDYHGEKDEVMIQVQRAFEGETIIKRGDKIAQGIFVMVQNFLQWSEQTKMERPSRGGFGTTDE